jgi:hypothetical protein
MKECVIIKRGKSLPEKEEFDLIAGTIKNRSEDEARFAITLVCVETNGSGKFIVATNGWSMRVTDMKNVCAEIPDGLYSVECSNQSKIILVKNEEEVKFPRWEMVAPNKLVEIGKTDKKHFISEALAVSGTIFDATLLSIALHKLEGTFVIEMEDSRPLGVSCVKITCGCSFAVVMPLRMDEQIFRTAREHYAASTKA